MYRSDRVESGEDLQMLIQDKIDGLTSMFVWVIGHVVE